MANSRDEMISFGQLNSIFKEHLSFADTVEELGLIAELVSGTTKSEAMAVAIMEKMRIALEKRNDYQLFFDCSDHALRLGRVDYEEALLTRGFELAVGSGCTVSEFPEQLERIGRINPRNPKVREFVESTIERRLKGLRQHGDAIVKGLKGESWADEVSHLIRLIDSWWSDHPYCVLKIADLVAIEGVAMEERAEAEEHLIEYMKIVLREGEKHELDRVYSALLSRELHCDEHDGTFRDLLKEFRMRTGNKK